jgi:hypothetical protein
MMGQYMTGLGYMERQTKRKRVAQKGSPKLVKKTDDLAFDL